MYHNKTADEIIEIMLEGNRNFANNEPKTKHFCFKEMKKSLTEGQKPYAAVLACSDSRVCPEIVFDAGLGELFTVRTAGNTIGPNILESLEYAVKKLKVKLLVILGHQDCGVMKYALSAPLYNDEFENLIYQVQSVKTEQGITCSNDLSKEYTQVCKKRLLIKSSIIKNAVEKNELKIIRAYFSLESGKVEIL